MNDVKRFWAKVRKTDDCWEWTGSRNGRGYGQIFWNGRTMGSHRVVWELTHGPIPDGHWVSASCGNYICCRPDHLQLSTRADQPPPIPRRDFAAYFWSMIDKTTDPGGCWYWTGGTTVHGYGQTFWNGKMVKAHRVAWELTRGPIPEGQCVCHTCDCRICCRGSHLWLGSIAENIKDMYAKGRDSDIRAYGEDHGNAKLTWAAVADIRSRHAAGRGSLETLGREYGVCESTIARVVNRSTWNKVP
jgi:hypothetical protein